jgi:hypothetical protein
MSSNNHQQLLVSPRLIWFLLVDSEEGDSFKGTTASSVILPCTSVIDQFRDAVKTKYDQPNYLKDVPSGALHVFANRPAFEMRDDRLQRTEPLKASCAINDYGRTEEEALVVVVPISTSPSLKPFRQQRYKTMSVEASCRKYLDAIASRLAEFYEFDYRHRSGATIGDVLVAKDGSEGTDWNFRRAVKTHQRIEDDGYTAVIRQGQPLTDTKLPDVYTIDEWNKISKLNRKTTERVRSGYLPILSNGRPYIVIPHADFTPEMISFLKNIGVKASLLSSSDVLVVKDEETFCENLQDGFRAN